VLEIVPGQYVSVTPFGAFYAVSEERRDPFRDTLLALMEFESSPLLSEAAACAWCGVEESQVALETLFRLQSLAVIQGTQRPACAPDGPIESILPMLLPNVSDRRHALLADVNGFYLGSAGFKHETAEELAAMSADVLTLHARHARLLGSNLGIESGSWAVVDAAGASQIGIWPIHIRTHRFALVVSGRPCFHGADFAGLVWSLARRYGG